MKKQALCALLTVTVISLSACQSTSLSDIWSDDSDNKTNSVYYPENSATPTKTTPVRTVTVPQSYYLSEGKPQSHKNVDKNWVNEQNSSSYTIELATGKASSVAEILQNSPKDQRMAQVAYGNGKYAGVYGTFPSQSAAQAALDKLPPDLRKNAQIQSWDTVQENVSSAPVNNRTTSITPPVVQ